MPNEYKGNRYVPKVYPITDPWRNDRPYESLVVIPWQGNSFTSRKAVPVGVDINNTDYWMCTGNYNVQVEQYRQDSNNAVLIVNNKLDDFENSQDGKFQIMLNTYKGQINSYADGKYSDINDQISATNVSLANTENDINNSMTNFEETIQQSINDYTVTVSNQVTRVQTLLTSIDIVYDAGTSTDIQDPNETIIDGGEVV